jgi:hypothetical protein
MVSPITLATQGVLDSPLAVAAARGHLTFFTVVTQPGGGGQKGGLQGTKHYTVTADKLDDLRAQLKREDEEIIAIVMAAMEVIQ